MTTPHSKRKRTAPKEYSQRKEMEKVFPSWDADSLRYTVRWMMLEAESAKPGDWIESPLDVFPDFIALDFDGQGGILVNPQTMTTPKGRELALCLRLMLGDKVRVGIWSAA